jgi:hypothetical protein
MRTRWLRILLAIGLLGALAVAPVAAEEAEEGDEEELEERELCHDEDGNLVFDEVEQWIKAPDARLGNVGAVSEATGQDISGYPTWSDEEPTGSVTDGAGGGTFQQRAGNPLGAEFNREAAGHFEGEFTGCIDNIAWDLYLLSPLPPLGGTVTTIMRVFVDGTLVFQNAANEAPEVNAPEVEPGLYRMQFAFTGLYDVMSRFQTAFEPLEETHTIEITLFSQFINDAQGFYVYDTTEAPSQLTFNKTEGLDSYTLIQTQ